MMRRLIARHGRAPIRGASISVLSVTLVVVIFAKSAAAQSPPTDQPPLTDRERSLVERIQDLENELAVLRDAQVRLAAIVAKLSEGSAKRSSEGLRAPSLTPDPQPISGPAPQYAGAPTSLSTPARSYWGLITWSTWNPDSGFTFLKTDYPNSMPYYRVIADALSRPHPAQDLFGRGALLRRTSYNWLASDDVTTLSVTAVTHDEPPSVPGAIEPPPAESDSPTPPTASSSPPPNPASGASGQHPQNQSAGQPHATAATAAADTLREGSNGNPAMFGEFNPGQGFVVGKTPNGELDLSGYFVTRYLDQMPPHQSAMDHLGRPIPVNPRRDFQFHRVMLFFQGWLFSIRFRYQAFVWTVQDTNQVAVGGALTYNFSKYFTLGGGWNAYPGTQSLQGSHPYWVSYDRVMADEFFRPYFSQGVFAQGIIVPRLEYRWLVGNNLSNLDVPAIKLDRNLSAGGALTWLPTTGEFGPRGAFGDYESHEKLATRFNLAYTFSPEDRQIPTSTPLAANTTIRLADSVNIFDTGALANGVTVQSLHYNLISAAAGIKYRGFWLQGEGYGRKLDHIIADGPLPVSVVKNTGFYVQTAYMIVPRRVELYAATSYVLGDFGRHPHEFLGGGNYYPWNTRNLRLNVQLINVSHSPVNSTFGFYTGQITGPVLAIGFTAFY